MHSKNERYPQDRPTTTPTPPILLMNQNDPPSQQPHLNRHLEIDSMADLSLFRSHSMPIPSFAGAGADRTAFLGSRPLEDQDEQEEEEEEEEDDDELLATPPFIPPPTKNHRLFSCSLPPSLDRRKTHSSHPQHENALHEFFQLTQPMREGLISREKLLPSSRMKQVGIGGRGRRALSNHKMTQNPYSPTSEFMTKTAEQGAEGLPSPIKFDHSLHSPGSSSYIHHQSSNMSNNLSSSIGSTGSMTVQSQFAQVPLIRPRPILAWDHPSRQFPKKEIVTPSSESNYQSIK